MRRNLYDLLGVDPDDDAEHVRKAFIKAAKESHPDHHGDDPDAVLRFRQIAEAYDILRDPERRAAYDRLLEAERRPPSSKLKTTFSDTKRHIVTDAIIGVVLVVGLVGGYELYARAFQSAVDGGARMTARGPAEIAASQPAEQRGRVERDTLESGRPEREMHGRVSSPQMPVVLPIDTPIDTPVAPADAAKARQTIEVARDGSDYGSGSVVPADRAGAKAGPDASANRADEPQDRRDAPSAGVQVVQAPAAETSSGVPGPSSSAAKLPANTPDRETPEPAGAGIAKQPAESAETSISARIHASVNRPPASRAPFRHTALARRHAFASMHAQYCEGD
jgi:curved DNA-binding protein CbpA